ncbi:MAG: hypothetical protein AB1726_11340 [Planctomycetota bacterium]
MIRRLPGLVALLLWTACLAPRPREMPHLARAEVAGDFSSYQISRIGILPFGGAEVGRDMGAVLQQSFQSELGAATPYELVMLGARDLEELERSEPHRRGWYEPRTIIGLSQRYRLDALLFGTIVQQRPFPPQILSVQVDLVSAETGLVIWSADVHLDAVDPRVRDGLQLFYEGVRPDENAPEWTIALLSPERFARFAAYQVASLL